MTLADSWVIVHLLFGLLIVFLVTGCADDDDPNNIRPTLADWQCREHLENELYPDSVVDTTNESIENLCNNDKFRILISVGD